MLFKLQLCVKFTRSVHFVTKSSLDPDVNTFQLQIRMKHISHMFSVDRHGDVWLQSPFRGSVSGKVSLSNTSHLRPASVWTTALCVNLRRTSLQQMCERRRYDPAAACPLGSARLGSAQLDCSKSVQTARLQERREGSDQGAVVQSVAVAGFRISFQLLAGIPGIFFGAWTPLLLLLSSCSPPLLSLEVISLHVSVGLCLTLFFQQRSEKCVRQGFSPL